MDKHLTRELLAGLEYGPDREDLGDKCGDAFTTINAAPTSITVEMWPVAQIMDDYKWGNVYSRTILVADADVGYVIQAFSNPPWFDHSDVTVTRLTRNDFACCAEEFRDIFCRHVLLETLKVRVS